jgi:DNA mismatch repair protein MutS
VVARARVILDALEADHLDEQGRAGAALRPIRPGADRQMSLFEATPHPVLAEIRDLDLESMTPLAALEELNRIRQSLLD